MKKMICSLLMVTVVLSTPFTSLAASKENENTARTNILIVREDVAREEAMNDVSFNLVVANKSRYSTESKAVTWNVWGVRNDGKLGATPIGYSEHKDGDTVLDTYHYTRTYLGEIMKSGDSGRKWGTKTVRAEGTYCDYGVWETNIHIVKYGTES